MGENPTVLFVGHINWDVVLHTESVPSPDFSSEIDNHQSSVGGSAANSAVLSDSLSVDTHLAGSIGDDSFGEKIRQYLSNTDVTTHLYSTDIGTTVIYALITEDSDPRYFDRNVGVGTYTPEIISSWEEIDHIHVTSFSSLSEDFARKAKENNCTVSFNPSQGYESFDCSTVIELADLVVLNKREAEIFRQRHNLGKVVEDDTVVVITHGGAGCTAYSTDGVTTHSGYSVDALEDTVGAGDAFVSGLLSKWTQHTNSIEDCLQYANACGATAVQQTGSPDTLSQETINNLIKTDTHEY